MSNIIYVNGSPTSFRSLNQLFLIPNNPDLECPVNGSLIPLQLDYNEVTLSFFINDEWVLSTISLSSTVQQLINEIIAA